MPSCTAGEVDEVEIVEDEHEVARHPADVVQQGHERGLG